MNGCVRTLDRCGTYHVACARTYSCIRIYWTARWRPRRLTMFQTHPISQDQILRFQNDRLERTVESPTYKINYRTGYTSGHRPTLRFRPTIFYDFSSWHICKAKVRYCFKPTQKASMVLPGCDTAEKKRTRSTKKGLCRS